MVIHTDANDPVDIDFTVGGLLTMMSDIEDQGAACLHRLIVNASWDAH